MTLGIGEYNAYLTARGGGKKLYDIDCSGINGEAILDGSGTCSLTLTNSVKDEVRINARTWKHEVQVFRGDDLVFWGPLVTIQSGQFGARDLYYWMYKRIIDKNINAYGDLVDAFRTVFDYAYNKDPSPNIELVTHDSGVTGVRKYLGNQHQKASDILGELARTALDFTTIGRTIYVGGSEVFAPGSTPAEPLILHDEAVSSFINPDQNGDVFATSVFTFSGNDPNIKTPQRTIPLVGHADALIDEFGLIEVTVTELLIHDLLSANQNASAYLHAFQPAPIALSIPLSPNAAFEFKQLIPGRRVNVKLSTEVCAFEIVMQMRLTGFSYGFDSTGEKITLTLAPLGIIQDAA